MHLWGGGGGGVVVDGLFQPSEALSFLDPQQLYPNRCHLGLLGCRLRDNKYLPDGLKDKVTGGTYKCATRESFDVNDTEAEKPPCSLMVFNRGQRQVSSFWDYWHRQGPLCFFPCKLLVTRLRQKAESLTRHHHAAGLGLHDAGAGGLPPGLGWPGAGGHWVP